MLLQHPRPLHEPTNPLLLERNQWLASSSSRRKEDAGADFSIRIATVDDAEDIAHIGKSVFSSTFGFSMPSVDLNAYLDQAYDLIAIQQDILSPSKHVFVACASSRVLGFVQLTEGTTDPCLAGVDSLVELQRLYISRESHGKGVGKALARRAEETGKGLGYRNIWLGVWEGNFVAQVVYERLGYQRVGDHEFKMGRCVQTDWIMCKEL